MSSKCFTKAMIALVLGTILIGVGYLATKDNHYRDEYGYSEGLYHPDTSGW